MLIGAFIDAVVISGPCPVRPLLFPYTLAMNYKCKVLTLPRRTERDHRAQHV